MKIQVNGRGFDLPEDARAYAAEKLDRLSRYYDRAEWANLVIAKQGDGFQVDAVISIGNGRRVAANTEAGDARSALDTTFSRLERQLRKQKEKIRTHRTRGAGGRKPMDHTLPDEEEVAHLDVTPSDLQEKIL